LFLPYVRNLVADRESAKLPVRRTSRSTGSCGSCRAAIANLLEMAPFRFIGKISLSAYLWHFPVMLLLGRAGLMASDTLGGMVWNVALGLTAAVLISVVTYYVVERPAVNWAKRYRYGTA
jgi:peptidoglycan/LPS O-acetylase OafA/YrhL